MARCTKRNELMFLSSVRVPSVVEPDGPDRDVGVAAEAALLEVAVVDADEHQDFAQRSQVGGGLGAGARGRARRRFRSAACPARFRSTSESPPDAVHVLAGVFLHVDARDADASFARAIDLDLELPVRSRTAPRTG